MTVAQVHVVLFPQQLGSPFKIEENHLRINCNIFRKTHEKSSKEEAKMQESSFIFRQMTNMPVKEKHSSVHLCNTTTEGPLWP